MLAEERLSRIMKLLSQQRTATVQELCEALDASESTIRRDLNELDRMGKVNKVHGGATLPDSQFLADEPTMAAKEALAVVQKKCIANAAALHSLQQYNFTKAFLGANGVALDAGFTTPDPEEAAVKAAVVRRAREAWFLVDDSKFARVYPAVIAELSGGAILTNHCPNPKYRQFTLVKEAAE